MISKNLKRLGAVAAMLMAFVATHAADNIVEYYSDVFTINNNDFYVIENVDTISGNVDKFLCHIEISKDGDDFSDRTRSPRMLLRSGENIYDLNAVNSGANKLLREYPVQTAQYRQWTGMTNVYPLTAEMERSLSESGASKMRYETVVDEFRTVEFTQPADFAKAFNEVLAELEEYRQSDTRHLGRTSIYFKDRRPNTENPLYKDF